MNRGLMAKIVNFCFLLSFLSTSFSLFYAHAEAINSLSEKATHTIASKHDTLSQSVLLNLKKLENKENFFIEVSYSFKNCEKGFEFTQIFDPDNTTLVLPKKISDDCIFNVEKLMLKSIFPSTKDNKGVFIFLPNNPNRKKISEFTAERYSNFDLDLSEENLKEKMIKVRVTIMNNEIFKKEKFQIAFSNIIDQETVMTRSIDYVSSYYSGLSEFFKKHVTFAVPLVLIGTQAFVVLTNKKFPLKNYPLIQTSVISLALSFFNNLTGSPLTNDNMVLLVNSYYSKMSFDSEDKIKTSQSNPNLGLSAGTPETLLGSSSQLSTVHKVVGASTKADSITDNNPLKRSTSEDISKKRTPNQLGAINQNSVGISTDQSIYTDKSDSQYDLVNTYSDGPKSAIYLPSCSVLNTNDPFKTQLQGPSKYETSFPYDNRKN